jgi:integrase
VPIADGEARKLGLLVDWKAPEARPVLVECLRAYRAAHADLVQRDRGHDIVTPPLPTVAPASRPAVSTEAMTLREVFHRWKKIKKRSPDSIRACERAVELFEQHFGIRPVQQVTRPQGDEFRAWLQTLGTSSKTARDRLTWVKSLLRYACRDLELLNRQPWEGIDIEHRTENPRKPWTDEQIKAFFSLPIYTEFKLPKAWKAGGAAAYWVPLLGLYTGARVGELCQLRVVDVEEDAAGASIRITEEAEGAAVKTTAGLRVVPVHSELIRLGFLEYVDAMRKAGSDSLWPTLRTREGKPGGFFSAWFGEVRKQVTGVPSVPDFHSLRHTVKTALQEAGIDGDVIDPILGHETRGAGSRYAHPKAILRKAVESLMFPIALPKGRWNG